MSHHNYPNHGRFRQSPTGASSEVLPPDPFFHSIPHQYHNHALQNAEVPPALAHGQPGGYREDIPPPVGVARPDRAHRIDEAYQGNIDYHPQPLVNPTYISPDVGYAQDIPAQVQPNVFVDQRDLFGYVPQHVPPDPVQAFPHPSIHRVPTPNELGAENLRRLVNYPDAQVGMPYQAIVDYHPQPLANPAYVFPDVGHAQGIPVQVQPNPPLNQEHNLIGYIPRDVAPGPVQAAFPHPFVHRIPIPHPPPQARAENLLRLARHYLHHPDAQVSMAMMEAGTAGRIRMTVIFETPDF